MRQYWSRSSLLLQLVKDERGSILLQFTLYIVVTMGMIGLALDGSRYLMLNSDLQELADAAALAGAAELDGGQDAITRATAAANSLAAGNNVRWSDSGGAKIQSITFYKQLSDINANISTNVPQQAAFIKVTTGSWQVVPSFLISVGAISNNSTNATAVAGSAFPTCAPIQTYMCAASLPASLQQGTQMQLLSAGSGGSGNWGLIDPPSGSSTAGFLSQAPSACTIQFVNQNPGNGDHKQIPDGINVRFDQPSSANDAVNIAAPIVIDGFTSTGSGNTCNKQGDVSATSLPLPRDRFNGSGVSIGTPTKASLNAYWQNHHGANWPTDASGNPVSRYQAYLLEIAMGSSTWPTDSIEPHGAKCNAPASTDPRRRIISVAVLDGICPSGNSGGPYVFSRYADFFITESVPPAVGAFAQPMIYGEYLGTYSSNTPGSLIHHQVQLVR